MTVYTGTADNDTLTSGAGADSIFGDAGDDTIIATSSNITGLAETIDGGSGSDVLSLSGGGTFNLSNCVSLTTIETIRLASDATASLTLADSAVASGTTLTIDASAITTSTNTFDFESDYDSDGCYSIIGGSGNDTIYASGGSIGDTIYGGDGADSIIGVYGDDVIDGGAGNDTITGNGDNDTITGGAGVDSLFGGVDNDTFIATSSDISGLAESIDGGGGTDTLSLTGGGTFNLSSAVLSNLETISLGSDATASLTLADSAVASGGTLSVSASAITTTGNTFTFDGSAETNGKYSITGGAGGDTITAGAGADTLLGGSGADSLVGGTGSDVFKGSAANFAGDTIGDLTVGDSIVVTGSNLSSFNGLSAGTTLTVGSGQTVTLASLSTAYAWTASYSGGATTLSLALDTTAPAVAITSATTTNDDTPVISGTAEAGAAITLTIGGATYGTTATDGAWSIDTGSATASSGSLSLDANGTNAVSVSASDAAGNSAAANQTLTVDTTTPVFSSAAVNGTSLVLNYTDAASLDATNVPAGSAFSVSAGGASITVNSVAVNAAARTVTLTLASAVTYGQTVTVGYTDPSGADDTNAVQDASGNDAATITAQAVTNTTADSSDGGSSNSGVSVTTVGGSTTGSVILAGSGSTPTLSAQLPGGVGLTATGPTTDQSPGLAGATLTSAVTSLVGNAEQRAALEQQIDDFTQSLATDSQVTVRTLTPTFSGTTAPDEPIIITGGSSTEAVILDLSHLPPGTSIQIDSVAFVIIVGQGIFSGGTGQNYAAGDGSSQTIILGPDDDVTHGGGGDDMVGSLTGDDRLYGDDGNDTVSGGSDNDVLHGGAGNDSLDGGSGVDVAVIATSRSSAVVTGGTVSGEGTDMLTNVELVAFTDGITLTNTGLGGSFDEALYLAQNSDVAAAVASGLVASGELHFSLYGAAEGRDPDALFDAAWYLEQNADIAAAVAAGTTTAWAHYQAYGWAEGRDPSQYFDTSAYLAENTDVGTNPLDHFLTWGAAEGRLAQATAEGSAWLL